MDWCWLLDSMVVRLVRCLMSSGKLPHGASDSFVWKGLERKALRLLTVLVLDFLPQKSQEEQWWFRKPSDALTLERATHWSQAMLKQVQHILTGHGWTKKGFQPRQRREARQKPSKEEPGACCFRSYIRYINILILRMLELNNQDGFVWFCVN